MSTTLAAIFLAATTALPGALTSDAPTGHQAGAGIAKLAITTLATAPSAGSESSPSGVTLDVDAESGSYVRPCVTPEDFCSIYEDIDCEIVSQAPRTVSTARRRQR